jgi:hypothetical protein
MSAVATPLINQARDAVNPAHANPAATTQATQVTHSGIVVSPIVIGQPATARINCRRATAQRLPPQDESSLQHA